MLERREFSQQIEVQAYRFDVGRVHDVAWLGEIRERKIFQLRLWDSSFQLLDTDDLKTLI